MISVLPRHIPLRGVSHCCHGCLQYTAIISPDTHTRSGRLHSSHPPRSSPARLPAALHLALRSGVLGRCSPRHHPHSHPARGNPGEEAPGTPQHTHHQGNPGLFTRVTTWGQAWVCYRPRFFPGVWEVRIPGFFPGGFVGGCEVDTISSMNALLFSRTIPV